MDLTCCSIVIFMLFSSCVASTVRLTNGSYSHEGRIEVYSNGQWYNVCGHYKGFKTADMICKELGYSFAIHSSDEYNFGEGSASMLSIPVICEGTEKKLEECTFKYDDICPHSRDAGVVCSTAPLEEGSVRLYRYLSYRSYACGEVQVYLNGRWGGIGDRQNTWNEVAAEVACKQMGFDGQVKTSVHKNLYETKQIIGFLYCTGKESRLLDCHYDTDISSRALKSKYHPGVMACCYYKTFTLWFTFKLLISLVLLVGVPICLCVTLCGWCIISTDSLQPRPAAVKPQRQVIRPVAVYDEVHYTVTRKRISIH